ncbi:MAG: 23S rRNA (guanosine(2251)-2'-O)-methyltransferase RlmB [Christensenellaceae bacterium]|jgi:23S rRNA (guanosine2251-2'-O)-methyltransferase|nr:23S rRNA (guanosine(2251)-2'-O)-methyltransferase RlmB [Christensenellaceae bacterium]
MIITGLNAVSEALESEMTVEKIYIRKDSVMTSKKAVDFISKARKKGIRIIFEERSKLDVLFPNERDQRIIAETTEFKYIDFDELLSKPGENKLYVILSGIEDPHNLGAILRVCESVGVTGVIIPERRAVGVNDTVMRASAGAATHVPTAKVTNINNAIRTLKDNFVNVYSADSKGESVYSLKLSGDIAVVIGSEGNGVPELAKKLSDKIISLPQRGKVNSLNASVATGIILYEIARQRLEF